MIEVLRLLEKDGSMDPSIIAETLGLSEQEVKDIITECERKQIIMGRAALIDWDKVADDTVTALIEVKISPQKGEGFDRIARRIYQYEQVESLALMSGAYDLSVTLKASSLKDVAQFVYGNLATIDGVSSTSTHFVLKKYKEKNKIYAQSENQEDRVLFV